MSYKKRKKQRSKAYRIALNHQEPAGTYIKLSNNTYLLATRHLTPEAAKSKFEETLKKQEELRLQQPRKPKF